jgi:hypothetical protein
MGGELTMPPCLMIIPFLITIPFLHNNILKASRKNQITTFNCNCFTSKQFNPTCSCYIKTWTKFGAIQPIIGLHLVVIHRKTINGNSINSHATALLLLQSATFFSLLENHCLVPWLIFVIAIKQNMTDGLFRNTKGVGDQMFCPSKRVASESSQIPRESVSKKLGVGLYSKCSHILPAL